MLRRNPCSVAPGPLVSPPRRPEGWPGVSAGASTHAPRVAPLTRRCRAQAPGFTCLGALLPRRKSPAFNLADRGSSEFLCLCQMKVDGIVWKWSVFTFQRTQLQALGQGIETNQGNKTDKTDRLDGPSGKRTSWPLLFLSFVLFIWWVCFIVFKSQPIYFRAGS
jgi:hypothetical protein